MRTYVNEGSASYHSYVFTGEDGVTPVEFLEHLWFKVTDGIDELIPRTRLPRDSVGTITVPGPVNRLSIPSRRLRYIMLFAVHNGGDHLTKEIRYVIKDLQTITPNTEPKE